jgi:hypothetical protein
MPLTLAIIDGQFSFSVDYLTVAVVQGLAGC